MVSGGGGGRRKLQELVGTDSPSMVRRWGYVVLPDHTVFTEVRHVDPGGQVPIDHRLMWVLGRTEAYCIPCTVNPGGVPPIMFYGAHVSNEVNSSGCDLLLEMANSRHGFDRVDETDTRVLTPHWTPSVLIRCRVHEKHQHYHPYGISHPTCFRQDAEGRVKA
ncbi:hypothetical protein R1flu_025127 [Riccia fluitans]|uniref:Uncharacterized protein n=1 Tax=Riccia fluitans TaxID=41844 RepID=A0ABD1XX89_9MARC